MNARASCPTGSLTTGMTLKQALVGDKPGPIVLLTDIKMVGIAWGNGVCLRQILPF